MDFIQYKCPICEKQFKNDDDIVVCPECGTPHHRECYENLGHCFYEDKHKEGFSFDAYCAEQAAQSPDDEGTVLCPNCNAENPKVSFYCEKCGAPLNKQDAQKQNTQQNNDNNTQNNNQGMPPFGVPFGTNPMTSAFDPMAGFKPDEQFTDTITAGEMSKFIGSNTQYFLRIFGNIKNYNTSRFNFAAFIFSGFYFLYRKMNVLGIVLSLLTIATAVGSFLVVGSSQYTEAANIFNSNYTSLSGGIYGLNAYNTLLSGMTSQQLFFLFLPSLLNLIRYIIMFVCGFIANRKYFAFCQKSINTIKSNCDKEKVHDELASKGGINFPLAICFGVVYLAANIIPMFM